MAKKSQRIGAAVAAGFFLIASLATTGAVIYTMMQQNNQGSNDVDQTANQQTNDTTDPLKGKQLEGFTPTTAPVASLQVTDIKVGDGAEAKAGSTVSVLYTGAVASTGTIFQSSQTLVSLSLNEVITGWKDGIPGMKVGGTRRLVIPAAQAYGANSPDSSIPPNSDLVFDVVLINVE